MANGTPAQGLMPQQGVRPEKNWYDFLLGGTRQDITAAMLDAAAAGQQSTFDRAGFYDALAEAQRAGRNIAGQQQALADVLRARAEGRGGPSLAELQLQQSLEANRAAAAGALAGAGRGINPALAQRLLLQQQSTLGQQAAGQGAVLRAQEQLAAQQALGQQLSGMRGAEGQLFGQAGQLGLGQEKLSVETQEAQRGREMDIALANQRAEQERQRLQQNQEQSMIESAQQNRRDIGTAIKEGATFAAGLAEGGKVKGGRLDPKNPDIYITKDGERTKRGLWANVYLKQKREGKADGGEIKALEKLDNKKNDVVPAMLSEGEIVLPRSVVASPNAPVAAAKFVEALMKSKDNKVAKKEALKAALSKKK